MPRYTRGGSCTCGMGCGHSLSEKKVSQKLRLSMTLRHIRLQLKKNQQPSNSHKTMKQRYVSVPSLVDTLLGNYFKYSPFVIECSTEGVRTKVNSLFCFAGLQYSCQVNSSETASSTLCFGLYEGPTTIHLVDSAEN